MLSFPSAPTSKLSHFYLKMSLEPCDCHGHHVRADNRHCSIGSHTISCQFLRYPMVLPTLGPIPFVPTLHLLPFFRWLAPFYPRASSSSQLKWHFPETSSLIPPPKVGLLSLRSPPLLASFVASVIIFKCFTCSPSCWYWPPSGV